MKDSLAEVVLEVDNPTSTLLLLWDMMAPGCQVDVDGQSAPLLTADLVLHAVVLEAEKHTVRFHCSEPAVSRGLTLSIAGGILTPVMILLPLALPRRGNATEGISSK